MQCIITGKKEWHQRPVNTTAKEGGGVSLGRALGTTKEVGYGVSRGTCDYHSRGEEYNCGVISERPVGTTTDWRGTVFVWGRPVSTANR